MMNNGHHTISGTNHYSMSRNEGVINNVVSVWKLPFWLVWIANGVCMLHRLDDGLPPFSFIFIQIWKVSSANQVPIYYLCSAYIRICTWCARFQIKISSIYVAQTNNNTIQKHENMHEKSDVKSVYSINQRAHTTQRFKPKSIWSSQAQATHSCDNEHHWHCILPRKNKYKTNFDNTATTCTQLAFSLRTHLSLRPLTQRISSVFG